MAIPPLSRNHVEQALARIDRHGVPKSRRATTYELVFDGKPYPPKYVVSLAVEYATGRELDPRAFGGGAETNEVLKELEFEVRPMNASSTRLLQEFERSVAGLPSTTEAERWVIQRVGQDLFRKSLLEFWNRRCAVTQLAVPTLLRASHIKRWADCASDTERLDVYNGLLLAPHIDAAFEQRLITVEDDGKVLVSDRIDDDARRKLGLDRCLRIRGLEKKHRPYLRWHRETAHREAFDDVDAPTVQARLIRDSAR